MDIGIKIKFTEYEQLYEQLKINCSKKQVRYMKKLLKDLIYYIKKFNLDNELVSKYTNMYEEIKKQNQTFGCKL